MIARRWTAGVTMLVLLVPAVGLGALGVVMVSSATARQGASTFGDPEHFAVRQIVALLLAAATGLVIARAGAARVMRAAPAIFVVALLAAMAVFIPGVGVRAAGASRWLRVGPLSGAPAPLLILAVGLLISAWGRPLTGEDHTAGGGALPRRTLAVTMGFAAILALVAEPDFSAAGIALLVGLAALAASGTRKRRLWPIAAGMALALVIVAAQFGYVGGRLQGFLSPERDRRGRGYEVLALARATSSATSTGVGLGKGNARRQLSSPGSDYVYAVIREELGKLAGAGVIVAWGCLGAAAILAARHHRDGRLRALALSAGVAMATPAALHMAVCSGWVPIIGVTMPLVSYDPGATIAAGAQVGLLAAVLTAPVTS